MEGSSTCKVNRKRGRGAAKPFKIGSKPMYIEFNQHGKHVGEFSTQFGKQIGLCAARVNITTRKWKDVDEHLKNSFWEETKVCFPIRIVFDLELYSICYLSCLIVYICLCTGIISHK